MITAERELRDPALASSWLSAGLHLLRLAEPTDEELRALALWLLATVGETPLLPPPAVIGDLGQLLLGRPLELRPVPADLDRDLRRALRRYEDHLLGRLVQEQRFTAATDAVLRLPPHRRPAAIGLATGALLDRLGFGAGVAIGQGLIRQLRQRPAALLQSEGASRSRPGAAQELLVEGYRALADAAEETATLLGDADVFALENLDVLGDLSQRVAIAQVVRAAEWLGQQLPAVLRARRANAGVVPTELDDESTYPTGGFSSVATVGSLENLVTSELVYMEDASANADRIDLFDVRYAEGELLYYTRDETFLVRPRRQVTFALAEELAAARLKDPELGWQRLVVLLGLILCTVRQLAERLGEEELRLEVVFLGRRAGQGQALEGERRLCELLLREWQERGLAAVTAEPLGELAARLAQATRRSTVQLVLCGLGDRRAAWEAESPDRRVWATCLDLGTARPHLWSKPPPEADDRTIAQAWAEATTALLEQLL